MTRPTPDPAASMRAPVAARRAALPGGSGPVPPGPDGKTPRSHPAPQLPGCERGSRSPQQRRGRAAAAAESPWRLSWRADPEVRALADRHYNRQNVGAPQFVPPGRCLVLKTAEHPPSAAWITSWPFAEYVQHAWAGAWVNSLFRNEGEHLSSDLIRWAVAHTRAQWPDVPPLGIVSFVDASKTEPKEVPGWCYRRAGWSHVGYTQAGLYVFQQLPGRCVKRRSESMPESAPTPGSQAALFEVTAS